ncbi:MAG: hypothetical protein LBL28_04510 [Treponema sp.]|jgi:hypothetical protein|nr:hypothetical protein [Treponema sp.]
MNKMNKKPLFLGFFLIFFAAGALFPLDFGGILSQNLKPENSSAQGDHVDLAYSAKISPWASLVLPNNLFLYLSASFSAKYELEEWKPVFEADRFEITWNPRSNIFVEAGRFTYTDPLALVADGLFDGAAVSLGLGESSLSLKAFYTGLLYKKTANITMSRRDALDHADAGWYWAPPRTFVSAVYTVPGLISWRDTFTAGLIGQFDLRGEDRLHTQYLTLQYLISPLDVLSFNLGGVFGLAQEEGVDPAYNYALSLRGDWSLPTRMNDQFSLRFRYASGLADNNEAQGAFTPISDISQSSVFSADFSGLMAFSWIFTLRPLESLSIVKESNFLMRTDLATFTAEGLDPLSESHVLGLELYLSLIWAPFSDLGLSAGGGVFFPLPESAFYRDTPPKWNVSLDVILSF